MLFDIHNLYRMPYRFGHQEGNLVEGIGSPTVIPTGRPGTIVGQHVRHDVDPGTVKVSYDPDEPDPTYVIRRIGHQEFAVMSWDGDWLSNRMGFDDAVALLKTRRRPPQPRSQLMSWFDTNV